MYQAGIYCRISIEEQNKEGEYSNSIHSQIQMARDYIAENKDIAEKKVYVDDGASGSNFERTEFRRMLADIELGVINMVIFKDVSRLGREHIDTNYYLGKYFPEKQIRIVSILDNYDSAVGTYDEMLEIKTLLNDMYLRDTSRKIKTTIQTKRSMGEYTPKQPPFGYVKSKTIHNHLEIDPYAAEVVRRIYRMYQNGFGCTVICRTLNEDEIPCPAKYKKEVLKTNYVWDSGKGLWTSSTVSGILKNPVYTGAVVIRKHERPSYKLKYKKAIPLEEMELVPDAHEAIISKEEFDRVLGVFWILHDTGYAVSEIPYTERKWWNRKVCGSITDPVCGWNHQYVQHFFTGFEQTILCDWNVRKATKCLCGYSM